MLLGVPRARGFILDGHGVFFDVEIPDMNQTLVWSVMTVQRDRQMGDAIGSLQTALKAMPAGPTLQQAQMALQAIEKTIGPVPPRGGGDAPMMQPEPRSGTGRRGGKGES